MYSKGSDSQSSTIKSGINTQNIEIRNENAQQALTGQSITETLAAIKTNISTDNAESQSGKLENRFDKNALQKELNIQVEATKGFVQTASAAGNAIANKLDEEAVAKQREAQAAQEEADRVYKANPSKENEAALNTANQNLITANNEADKWQTGGEYKRKIDGAMNAISAALGGLPAAGIATSAISPEINHQIKLATEGSPMANKVAHAVWGAVEAYSANQNAAAGAGGALAGEVMADVIAKELYGKKPNQLNREEKEVVSSVSQAAGALVGGMAANSSQGIGVGLTTTKNAVENNYLSKDDWDNYRKDLQNCQGNKQCQMDINKKYAKLDSEKHADLVAACKLGGSSSKCQTMSEEARDGVDYAVQEFYKPMFDGRNELWLRQRIEQGYSDSKKEPSVALLGDESLNNLNDMAKNPKVLKKLKSDENLRKEFIDAVDESTLAVRMEKSNAYEFGEGLSKYKNLVDLTDLTGGYKYFNREIPLESVYPEAFIAPFALRGAQAISSAEGLIVQGTSKVLPRVGMVAEKYPLLSELVVSGVINTGYQLSSKKEFSGDDLLKAELSTLFNRNKSLGQQTAINIGLNVMATTKPEDYGWNAISAVTGTLGSAAVSNGLSKVNISPSINKMVVPTGSAITSEYLGDAEKLKQYYRFLEEKYAK